MLKMIIEKGQTFLPNQEIKIGFKPALVLVVYENGEVSFLEENIEKTNIGFVALQPCQWVILGKSN